MVTHTLIALGSLHKLSKQSSQIQPIIGHRVLQSKVFTPPWDSRCISITFEVRCQMDHHG